MKLGIFGGTFDPVHYGHLMLAETCRQQLALDEVRFVPAGNPPHKSGNLSDAHARADMVQLAVSGYPEYVVDRREIRRQGPSWTVLTLEELQIERPECELFFLMGADSLADFRMWREPERIVEMSTVVAVNRPGIPLASLAECHQNVGSLNPDRFIFLSMPGADISATDLRERTRRGQSLRFLTPRAVERFLTEHNLYRQTTEKPG
jgi:nicotinate-nucleotide adenylyltransferase